MNLIHYMVRKPERLGKLIYPIELEDHDYQAYGSFFMDGRHENDVSDAYLFHAVRDDSLVPIKLRRVGLVSFAADVPVVGRFLFKATTVGIPARYGGSYPFPRDAFLVRQLAPSDRRALERAAFEFKFYFTGFSPQIEDVPEAFRSDPRLPGATDN